MPRPLALRARPLARALAVAAVVLGPALARAQGYTFDVISPPFGNQTSLAGVSDAGEIVGYTYASYPNSPSVTRSDFLYAGGTYRLVAVPGAIRTNVAGISAGGQIVGSYFDAAFNLHGFVGTAGAFTTVDAPGASSTQVNGANDAGALVGRYSDLEGDHAFLYDGGTFTTLLTQTPGNTWAYGINAAGVVVGGYEDTTGHEAAFRYAGGTFSFFNVPGAIYTEAYGINAAGQIVGEYSGRYNGRPGIYGFVYDAGVFTTLDLPYVPFGSSAFPEAYATGINDAGQVAGYYYAGSDGGGYYQNGFLATPMTTPEPGPIALVGAGLAGVGAAVRRRRRVATA